ncbi:MAG: ABC transporter ATP-binding protein [Ignavibacteriales bacterium]|nr:ABC transporter ATP-binding protein [Ignavibacteriales bacterium]
MNIDQSNIVLTCHHLTKSYTINNRSTPVLKGVDLIVHQGEIAVIQGKNGAGKTTLIEILGGLSRPNSGSILFTRRLIESQTNEQLAFIRREKIGIIFQSFNLIPTWTAFENIEAALLHTGLSKSYRCKKVKMLLEDIGLENEKDHLPSELSIGQQQRVAIARALAHEPILILADEPTGEIDKETSKQIIDYLMTPIKKKGVTLIVTTHGNFPLNVADRTYYLKDGRLQNTN